jgi:hypothetical protein
VSEQATSRELGRANSVSAESVPLLGGRLFWIYTGAPPVASGAGPEMFNAAFEKLEREFEPGGDGPIGLCVPIADRAEIEGRPEVVWPETELMYAGYLPDGTQLRIRYFDEAAIGSALPNSPTLAETRQQDYPLEERHRMEPFGSGEVTADDVLALWAREGAVPEVEAKRRVHEVHIVATDRKDGLVGISSAYLRRNAQLRMDLWYYRAFVARAHRMSSLAGALAVRGRELLEERFVSGEDTRAGGIIYEVENPGLKRYFNKALWLPTDFTFIGESELGAHVRVHYFPGATAP